MTPVRALHVLACDELAGTERMVMSLILRSDAAVVCHELATFRGPGPVVAGVRAGGRRATALGALPGGAWRLGRLLRARNYDVVAAYGLKASAVTRLLVRLAHPRAGFVCGVRGQNVAEVGRLDSPKARVAWQIERLLSPLVDMYDANSRAALELLAALGVAPARLTLIPNGLDLAEWPARRAEQEDGTPALIVCAARFVECKRHADLLAALALLRQSGRSFRAVLVGGGPLLPAMRALAASLDLGGCVELPGPVASSEVRGLLARAAVAVLPSASEGMPGALMEAMASGVAVVATGVGGTCELVVDGESGLLVAAYAPAQLAAALARLIDDRPLRDRLAAAGRRRMEEHFSLATMLAAKTRLFLELADRRSRRG